MRGGLLPTSFILIVRGATPARVFRGALILLLLLIAPTAWGSAWEGAIIREIHAGSLAPTDPDWIKLTGLTIGSPYQTDAIRHAISTLYKTGHFSDIWVEVEPLTNNGIAVRFQWIIRKMISSIRLTGNYFIADQAILNAAGIHPQDGFTEEKWKQHEADILSLYRQKGFLQAKIETQFETNSPQKNRLEAVVKIKEGSLTRIRNIQFTGHKIFSDFRLLLKLRSQEGRDYQPEIVEQDILRLRNFYDRHGYLKAMIDSQTLSLYPTKNQIDLVIHIESFEKIEIVFKGQGPMKNKELKEVLLIQEERSDREAILNESALRLERFYHERGYPLAKVQVASRQYPNENKVEIDFSIETGARTKIKKVAFSGNHTFPEERLLNIVRLNTEQFLKTNLYTEAQLEASTSQLLHFYKQAGFRTPQISSSAQFDANAESAIILFTIIEGSHTSIGQVDIDIQTVPSQGQPFLTPSQIKDQMPLTGTPYDEWGIKEAIRQLLRVYARAGFIYAEIRPETLFEGDPPIAYVTLRLVEGKQIEMGTLQIEGTHYTQDRVVLREITLKQGDPYDEEKLLKSQQELYRTGLFSSVRFNRLQSDEKPLLQDTLLSITERPRWTTEIGFGYADREQFLGLLEIGHKNILGTGRRMSVRGETSAIEKKYTLRYTEPWFLPRLLPIHTGAYVDVAFLDQKEVSFDLKTISDKAGMDVRLSERTHGLLFYQYELRDTRNVQPTATLTADDIGKLTIATLNAAIIRDTRDDPFNSTIGSVNNITFRNGAFILGSKVQMVKMTTQSSWYRSPTSNLVLAISARAGISEKFGETQIIPISERFFVGGRNTIRGYDQDQLGVEGQTILNGSPTGGNVLLIFNEEVRIRFGPLLGGVFFLDHGNVWQRYADFRLSDIKSTIGLGIRYNTPVGPLRLDWGYKLNRGTDASAGSFHFTLGHTF